MLYRKITKEIYEGLLNINVVCAFSVRSIRTWKNHHMYIFSFLTHYVHEKLSCTFSVHQLITHTKKVAVCTFSVRQFITYMMKFDVCTFSVRKPITYMKNCRVCIFISSTHYVQGKIIVCTFS